MRFILLPPNGANIVRAAFAIAAALSLADPPAGSGTELVPPKLAEWTLEVHLKNTYPKNPAFKYRVDHLGNLKCEGKRSQVFFDGKIAEQDREAVFQAAAALFNGFGIDQGPKSHWDDGDDIVVTLATKTRRVRLSMYATGQPSDAGRELATILGILNSYRRSPATGRVPPKVGEWSLEIEFLATYPKNPSHRYRIDQSGSATMERRDGTRGPYTEFARSRLDEGDCRTVYTSAAALINAFRVNEAPQGNVDDGEHILVTLTSRQRRIQVKAFDTGRSRDAGMEMNTILDVLQKSRDR